MLPPPQVHVLIIYIVCSMYILYRGLNKVFIVHFLQTTIILSPVISYM